MKISISAQNVSAVITGNDGAELINYSTKEYKLEVDVAAIITSGASLTELFNQAFHKVMMAQITQNATRDAARNAPAV